MAGRLVAKHRLEDRAGSGHLARLTLDTLVNACFGASTSPHSRRD